MITTMIVFGARSLYRSRQVNRAITAGQPTKSRYQWRRLRAKFKAMT